jgi:hypothetical protein
MESPAVTESLLSASLNVIVALPPSGKLIVWEVVA